MGINNYTGDFSYYDDYQMQLMQRAEAIKKANKDAFNNFSDELNAAFDNKCDVCYQRYVCRYKNKGNCPTPQSYFSSEIHDKQVRNEAFKKLKELMQEKDSSKWAMFSRTLIEEMIDEIKEGKRC